LCNHVSIDAETVVFRTVQEAIQNAAKHAKASEVTVRLWQNEDKLMGVVEDDGMGIRGGTEPQDEEPGYHVGIAASRCSLEQLGGTLQVSPREGGGTRVSFEVPGQAEIGTRHRTSVR
jgi:signal transduction histidine kinase